MAIADIVQVRKNLSCCASVSFFERTKLETFCKTLSKSLQDAVLLATTKRKKIDCQNDTSHRYNYVYKPSVVQQCLVPPSTTSILRDDDGDHDTSDFINWTRLMLHHDCVVKQHKDIIQSRHKSIHNKNNAATPLDELVKLLAYNPSVVPHACSQEVFMAFWLVLVHVSVPRPPRPEKRYMPRIKWTDSQLLILNAMEHLLTTKPSSTMQVGRMFTEYTKSQMLPGWNRDSIHDLDCEPLHRMASVLKHLAKSCTNRSLGGSILECLVVALLSVDHADVRLLQNKKRAPLRARTTREATCVKCQASLEASPQIGRQRGHIKMSEKSMSLLHDNNDSRNDPSSLVVTEVKVDGGGTVDCISRSKESQKKQLLGSKSFKDILKSLPPPDCSTRLLCRNCDNLAARSSTSASEFTKLPLKTVFLRTRLYRKAVSVFMILTMSCNSTNHLRKEQHIQQPLLGTFQHRGMTRSELWLLKHMIHVVVRHCLDNNCKNPCSSLRLCLVLFADVAGAAGYELLTDTIWALYDTHKTCATTSPTTVSKGEMLLRIYSELIVECSFFDNPTMCWKAMQPLVDHLLQSCHLHEQQSGDEAPMKEKVGTSSGNYNVRLPLRCVSYILSRRRNGLVMGIRNKDLNGNKYRKLVSQLSLLFGQKDMWISSGMTTDEKEQVIQTMQASGVLGLFESATDDINQVPWPKTDAFVPRCSCIQWPFPELSSLRNTHQRMGPHVGRRTLLSTLVRLSSLEQDNALTRTREHSACNIARQPDERTVVVPMLDYLDDDVLHNVFSFLGYKRLIRVSRVCRSWHSVAKNDVLWRTLYKSRFGLLEDDCKSTSPDMNWKDVFVNKWVAESDLRFKRNSAGWKHRTCGYVGCFRVLRSSSQMEKHFQTHKTQAEKKEKMAKKKVQKQKNKTRTREAKKTKSERRKRKKEFGVARKTPKRQKTAQIGSPVQSGCLKLESDAEETLCSEDEAFKRYLLEEYIESEDEASKPQPVEEDKPKIQSTVKTPVQIGQLRAGADTVCSEDEAFKRYLLEEYVESEDESLKRKALDEALESEGEAFERYLLEEYVESEEE